MSKNVVCLFSLLHIIKCTPEYFHHGRKHYWARSDCSFTKGAVWPRGYKTWVHFQTQNKGQWLAACGHVSASSQSLRLILSLRMKSSFITSRPDLGPCWWSSGVNQTLVQSHWNLANYMFTCKISFEKNIGMPGYIWASAWDFQQCGMCDQQNLRSACAYVQSDQSLCLSLEHSIIVKLLTEHHLEFLSLKGGCRGSSESTLVELSNCWKSHATAHII